MKLFLSIILLLTTLATHAATPTNNVPISQMPITTNVIDNAYFPLIQPYPGRTTNDNFRATTATIFTGRGTGTFTNIYVTNLFVTNLIMLAGTNVASVNPTIGRIPYKDTTNTFGDSALYFIDTNTVGTVEIDTSTLGVTNLVTGGVVQSVDSGMGFGYLTNVVNGSGALTNDGAGNLGWSTFTATEQWTNSAGVLQPVDLTSPLRITNSFFFGPSISLLGDASGSLLDVVSYDVTGANFLKFINTNISDQVVIGMNAFGQGTFTTTGTKLTLSVNGGTDYQFTGGQFLPPNGVTVGVTNQSLAGFWMGTGGIDSVYTDNGTTLLRNGIPITSGAGTTINATDTYLPARLNATTFTNSPLYTVLGTNIGIDSGFYLGPGTSNWVGRATNDVVITNNSSGASVGGLRFKTGDGSESMLTAAGNVMQIRGNVGVTLVDALTSGNSLSWVANTLRPSSTSASLGQDAVNSSPPSVWMIIGGKTNFIYGYTSSSSTNYSRLLFSHGGTNDFAHIDSEGAGDAGTGKPILLRVGATVNGVRSLTNMVQFDGTSGASTTGMLLYENGTAQRVSIGAADSGGAGFRVLRVPN